MSSFWAAFSGVIAGVVTASAIEIVKDWIANRRRDSIEKKQKELLKEMLESADTHGGWRKLATLSGVVGADPETTKRLLLDIGARGSEKGDDKWALVSKQPLPSPADD